MVSLKIIYISAVATIKSLWKGGSPFAGGTALWPVNEEGKYVIQSEGIRLAFTNRGGALTNLWINDTHGKELDVVLGFDRKEDYEVYAGSTYIGSTIGRYAGPVSNGRFTLADGVTYNVSADGETAWHGGERGWGKLDFDVVSHTENSITFVVFDRAGTGGWPGTCASVFAHTVTPYEWHIVYGITPTRTSIPIPANVGHQVFWNLDGFDGQRGGAEDHILHLPFSGMRIALDDRGIPTGDIKSNTINSPRDFWSSPKQLHPKFSNSGSESAKWDGLDETFIVAKPHAWNKESNPPIASMWSPHSGVKLDVFSDQEAIRLLTWNESEGTISLKKRQGGQPVKRNEAVSLTLQEWPDAVNHPEWQRNHKMLYGTDNLYTTFSKFRFSLVDSLRAGED